MSLLESNRNKRNVKPIKSANLSDILDDSSNAKESSTKASVKNNDRAKNETNEGYKTSLTIDSKIRNMIAAMVLVGDAPNQKEGMSIAMHMYYDNLPDDKKSMFDLFYKSIENNDKGNKD